MLRKFPDTASTMPFEYVAVTFPRRAVLTYLPSVALKPMKPAYHVQAVVAEFSTLQHGQDGLIFTNAETPYIAGTDSRLYVPLQSPNHSFSHEGRTD